MKFLLIILTLFSINGCAAFKFVLDNIIGKPRYTSPADVFAKDLEDATPDFRQGWYDGCESGMAAGSNKYYQTYYKNNKVDGYKMSYSTEYRNSWTNGWWYCYRKDWTNQRSSIWGSVFKGYR